MQFFSKKKKQNNEDIVEEVILEHYNQYFRLAYSYVHNEADASDIVQNGAYKALRGSNTLKNPEYASTWVYRIMLNEIFSFLRQPKLESFEHMQEERGDIGEATVDSYCDMDLQQALDTLSPREKAIVSMKYFEEKTLEEIAEILDENVNTVKSILYRSLRKLRVKLEEEPEAVNKNARKGIV